MSKASVLRSHFEKTERTEESLGQFKLKVFFIGITFDDGENIVFKDGSIAEFMNRDSLEECDFRVLKG